ncbi:iron chelate uptake ABC transporter family permease subunit [Lactiplantibacillus pentosus]
MSQRQRLITWTLALVVIIGCLAVLNLSTGSMAIGWSALVKLLSGQGSATDTLVLLNFRLPRIVLAIIVGWALASSSAGPWH